MKTVKSSVLIGTADGATLQHAGAHTFAPGAVARNHASSAPGATPPRAKSYLKPLAWARILALHPNQEYAHMINDYIAQGVPIMYDGPELTCINDNWNSTQKFKVDVLASIQNDLDLGRKSGPYTTIPCANFRSSPLGAFAKKHTGKVRIIHDLSWPPGEAVNTFIHADLCSVNYISVSLFTGVAH
jgi:hypothetical protein